VLPFMAANGEQVIWADMVGEIEKRVDARAESEWATPSSISVPALKFDAPPAIEVKASSARVKRDVLNKKIQAAAGPQSVTGPTNGNPNWPQASPQWVSEFGARLAEAIGEVADSVADGASIGPIDFSKPLQQLTKAVSGHVDTTLNAVSEATAGLQRRTNLLWWKEALFSPSARMSYREIPGSTAAALMAFDLHQQVPIFSPASVAAFLREAILTLPTVDQQTRPIRELLEEVCNAKSLTVLREVAADLVAPPAGRGPVLALIGHRRSGPALDERTFRDLVGVDGKTQLTASAWAVWIFRELQAARATNEGLGAKRRAPKG
jgi:GTPase-associated system helical domain